MKKNRKKVLIGIIAAIVIAILSVSAYFLFNSKDENALTLNENKWLDSNKYDVVDVALLNDIPILSYDGDGLVHDYLKYVTDNLSLKFNIIPYKLDSDIKYNYKLTVVDNPSENDIVILKDNMVLITTDNKQYIDVEDIKDLKIGILSSSKDIIIDYFKGKNIEFVEYNTYSELKGSIVTADTYSDKKSNNVDKKDNNTKLDGIIISKTAFAKEIMDNNYEVSFQFNDLNKYFVLSTNGAIELNSILRKNYNIWSKENYDVKYHENLLDNYFTFKEVSDIDQKTLMSKSYVYGFIDYGVFNYLKDKKISGLSGLILKDFNEFSSISITYTRYNSISKLLKDFNSKKVDFMINMNDDDTFDEDVYKTVGVFNRNLAIISGINNNYVIDSISSLKDKEVLIVKDTYLEKYLTDRNIKVKSYSNMNDLVNDFGMNDITIMDLENYNFYSSSSLKDCKINYLMDMPNKYNYVVNNTEDNKIFTDLFNFYVQFTSINELVSTSYNSIAYENSNMQYILVLIIIVLCVYVFIDFTGHFKTMLKTIKSSRKVKLSKEDKMKYIDQLTSLKNRAYLNSKIEQWDDSEVYPQAIIIIDLNNISYINDNYGREEGDRVITEAANILIIHQLQNSEIIRTDGDEFLIYLVGYSEKQIISYLRKLNKEMKGLSHGFGAASGYSIITDEIKTVDDAVNEATLDMKNNKEDIDY